MHDPLLESYKNQLESLRAEAHAFARRSNLAAELDIDERGVSRDPFVERLLQGAAFLAARIDRRLSDDFPELTESILSVLNPQQVQPFPPATVVQFRFPTDRPSGEKPATIPAGTALECSTAVSDVKPRFVTCGDVVVPRVLIREAVLGPALRTGELRPRAGSDAINELRFVLEPMSANAQADDLLLYLHSPASSVGYSMFELLSDAVDHVALSSADGEVRYLGPEAVEVLGPYWDKPLVPVAPGADASRPYALMADLAALPEKFLFFRIRVPGGSQPLLPVLPPGSPRRHWTVVVYLRREAVELQSRVKPDLFRTGCVPAVNLFPTSAEFPHRWTQLDHPIEPDRQRRSCYEIHSVLDVTASRIGSPDDRVRFEPLYHPRSVESPELAASDLPVAGYWSAVRRATAGRPDCGLGTDLMLRVVDPRSFRAWEGSRGRAGDAQGEGEWVLRADVLATNRNLVQEAAAASPDRRLDLALLEGGGQPLEIRTLVPPTEPGRWHLAESMSIAGDDATTASWRSVAAMTASRLWMVRPDKGDAATRRAVTRAFQDLLRLHVFHADPQGSLWSTRRIRGVTDVAFQSAFGRVSTAEGDRMCQGLKVVVSLNEDEFSDGSMYLFASAIERMLGFLAPINSFVQLETSCRQRGGSFGRWRKRAGETLLT